MSIPNAQMIVAELIINGKQGAAGSSVAPAYNVCHFFRTNTLNPWNNLIIADRFAATFGADLKAASNVRYDPQGISCRCLNDAQDLGALGTFAGPGAITTDGEPSDDAVVLVLKSAVRGKSFQGRKHFGATNESDTTGDILTGAGLARWTTVRDSYLAGFTDSDGNVWKPCVVSRLQSQLKTNPTKVTYAEVVKVKLILNIGTMRRRRTKTLYAA